MTNSPQQSNCDYTNPCSPTDIAANTDELTAEPATSLATHGGTTPSHAPQADTSYVDAKQWQTP